MAKIFTWIDEHDRKQTFLGFSHFGQEPDKTTKLLGIVLTNIVAFPWQMSIWALEPTDKTPLKECIEELQRFFRMKYQEDVEVLVYERKEC